MQTGAPQGAVGVSIASFAEQGGALQSPMTFPQPNSSTTASRHRHLLQSAPGSAPLVDSQVQILCQGCDDLDALLAALNSSTVSQLFSAYGAPLLQLFVSSVCLVTQGVMPHCVTMDPWQQVAVCVACKPTSTGKLVENLDL